MDEKSLYPKTRRVSKKNNDLITEKLDGSNIGFFKKNNKLIIAMRNFYFELDELEQAEEKGLLKGLKGWLLQYGNDLLSKLHSDGSGFFGEWLKENNEIGTQRIFMFAKANLDDDMNVYNIYYDHSLFRFPFINQEIPEYIGIVPVVEESPLSIRIDYLDKLFDEYEKKVNREVEGFIVCKDKFSITKYVRRKGGNLTHHKE